MPASPKTSSQRVIFAMATSVLSSVSSWKLGWLLGWHVWLLLSPGALAFSTGAPDSKCFSMVPSHGSSQANYQDPFRVTASSATYSPLQLLTVTIEPTVPGVYIRGFLVQARPANSRDSDNRVGFFIKGSGSKTACDSGAITHSYSTDRSSVTVSWRAPPSPLGDIVFRATVVIRYSDYYTAVDSPVISVQIPTTPPPTTTTTTSTTTTTTTTPTTTTTTPSTTTPPTTTTSTSTTTTTTPTTLSTTTTAATTTSRTTLTTTRQSASTASGTQSSQDPSTAQSSPPPTPSSGTTQSATTTASAETKWDPTNGTELARINTLFLLVLLSLSCRFILNGE